MGKSGENSVVKLEKMLWKDKYSPMIADLIKKKSYMIVKLIVSLMICSSLTLLRFEIIWHHVSHLLPPVECLQEMSTMYGI